MTLYSDVLHMLIRCILSLMRPFKNRRLTCFWIGLKKSASKWRQTTTSRSDKIAGWPYLLFTGLWKTKKLNFVRPQTHLMIPLIYRAVRNAAWCMTWDITSCKLLLWPWFSRESSLVNFNWCPNSVSCISLVGSEVIWVYVKYFHASHR